MESALRKIAILTKLSKYTKKTSVEICSALVAEGHNEGLRTIQRDLNELTKHHWVDADGAHPQGWRLNPDVDFYLPSKDLTTAIMFVLVEAHLKPIFPSSLYKSIEHFVDTAKDYLNDYNNAESDWANKVAVIPAGLQFEPTQMIEGIYDSVYQALFKNKKINVSYQSVAASTPEDYIVSPYGLIARADRKYLVVRFEGQESYKELALCRMCRAEMLDQSVDTSAQFSLSAYIAENHISRKRQPEKIQISLWVTDYVLRGLKWIFTAIINK